MGRENMPVGCTGTARTRKDREMKRSLDRLPFWQCAVSWDMYPFRIVWVGWWMVSYDRSGRWFERWPHISVRWNID